MTGIVFDIQHFCLDDGEGIRTVVFLKGCPLHCKWCHNPEGLCKEKELFYHFEACKGCGECEKVCPNQCHIMTKNGHVLLRENCILCGKCASVCSYGALRVIGKGLTANEVIEEVAKDIPFYQTSGGGLTISGGEPFYQPLFLKELLQKAKEKEISTCIETSGFVNDSIFEEILPYIDTLLFDMKECNEENYKKFTGADLQVILKNLGIADKNGKKIILRCPIVEGFNDREEHYLFLADLLNKYEHIERIEIEPYHPFGVDKYADIGKECPYPNKTFFSTENAQKIQDFISKHTNKEVIIS